MSTCHVGCAAQLAGQLVVLAQEGRQPQRSDRRFPNLSCPWALEAVCLTRRRRADFHQGQERTMKLLRQAEYMAATASPPTRQSPFARGWVHIRDSGLEYQFVRPMGRGARKSAGATNHPGTGVVCRAGTLTRQFNQHTDRALPATRQELN